MDIDNMEMPCRCDCGNWLELTDGRASEHSNKLICGECYEREQEESDREDEILELKNSIGDAQITIKDSKTRLLELNALEEPFVVQCEVCGQQYLNHSGSTPCCGARAFII